MERILPLTADRVRNVFTRIFHLPETNNSNLIFPLAIWISMFSSFNLFFFLSLSLSNFQTFYDLFSRSF